MLCQPSWTPQTFVRSSSETLPDVQLEGPSPLLLGPLLRTLAWKLSYIFPSVWSELQKGADITG